MAKSKTPNGVTLTYPATTAYKQWVWKEIRRRWPKGAQQAFVDEIKRKARAELIEVGKLETISTATISDFLGKEGETPKPSNSTLLPAFNKTLGISAPPVCDPTDEISQLIDHFRSRYASATPRERAAIVALLAGNDDEGGVERDSDRARETPAHHRKR